VTTKNIAKKGKSTPKFLSPAMHVFLMYLRSDRVTIYRYFSWRPLYFYEFGSVDVGMDKFNIVHSLASFTTAKVKTLR
jgi:hypothetical protein